MQAAGIGNPFPFLISSFVSVDTSCVASIELLLFNEAVCSLEADESNFMYMMKDAVKAANIIAFLFCLASLCSIKYFLCISSFSFCSASDFGIR